MHVTKSLCDKAAVVIFQPSLIAEYLSKSSRTRPAVKAMQKMLGQAVEPVAVL